MLRGKESDREQDSVMRQGQDVEGAARGEGGKRGRRRVSGVNGMSVRAEGEGKGRGNGGGEREIGKWCKMKAKQRVCCNTAHLASAC